LKKETLKLGWNQKEKEKWWVMLGTESLWMMVERRLEGQGNLWKVVTQVV
jgi:hypothetical protein